MDENNTKIESQTGFFSLADLAASNTDAVPTLLNRVPAAGIFRVRGVSIKGKEGTPQDGRPPLHRFQIVVEILAGTPADKNTDIETMLGKQVSESYTLWPDTIQEVIGLLKGRWQKIGLQNTGMPMGGVEGMEPGWLDLIVGHEFDMRIRNGVAKSGDTVAFFDYLPVKKESALEATA